MAIKTDGQLTTDNNTVATKHDDRFSFTTFLKNFLKDVIDSKLSSITGLINSGTNVTITGAGTSVNPFVINSSGGGGGVPAGSNGQIQFNNSGAFGANSAFSVSTAGQNAIQIIGGVPRYRMSTTGGQNSGLENLHNGITQFFFGMANDGTYGGTANTSGGRFIGYYDFVANQYRYGFNASGDLFVGSSNTSFTARLGPTGNMLRSSSVSIPTFVSQGIASQTADLAQFQNSGGTVLARITSVGGIFSNVLNDTTGVARMVTTVNGVLGFANINSGTATIIDITYANLVTAIGGSTLTRGAWYRITDFTTVHNILTSSPNVVNIGTIEPLIILATGINTLAEQAFSELYPQDIIRYEVANTKMAGATKGVILFRHDTDKNISCFYDWRNVKNRRYGISFSPTSYTIGNGIRLRTIGSGTIQDIYTFENSQTPTSTSIVNIGLLSENNRINNISLVMASSSYSKDYSNISIDNGCSNICLSVQSGTFSNVKIGKESTEIILQGGSPSYHGYFEIGSYCKNLFCYVYEQKNFIGNNVRELWSIGRFNIASDCHNITIDVYTSDSLNINTNCSHLYFNGLIDKITFDSNCSNIQILTPNVFSDVYFGAGFKNKIFNATISNTLNCKYMTSDATSKTYNTKPASGLVFDKVDSAGDLWATSIDTAGVISQVKMV